MKFQAITLLLAAATSVVAQAVTDSIAPTAAAPPGCKPTFDGRFEISIQDIVPQEASPALKVRLPPSQACPSPSLIVDLSLTTVSLRHRRAPPTGPAPARVSSSSRSPIPS